MTQTATQESEAPEVARIERVEDLPDPVRGEIVADRQAGLTLSELKTNLPRVAPDVIREVLPPANQRERKARSRKAGKAGEESTQTAPVPASTEPSTTEQHAVEPKPEEPRYAAGTERLSERVVAAREVVGGRNQLAALLGKSGSFVWRAERSRIHPDELAGLEADLIEVEAKIKAGDFVKAAAEPKEKPLGRAELVHRIEVAVKLLGDARAATVSRNKNALIDQALDALAPRPQESGTPPA